MASSKYTAETTPYKTPPNSDADASSEAALNRDAQDDAGAAGNHAGAYKGSDCSYTPSSSVDEHAYGKSGGKPNVLSGVPSVVVGGSSEVAALPAMPGTLRIGENKNVSTPVSG